MIVHFFDCPCAGSKEDCLPESHDCLVSILKMEAIAQREGIKRRQIKVGCNSARCFCKEIKSKWIMEND